MVQNLAWKHLDTGDLPMYLCFYFCSRKCKHFCFANTMDRVIVWFSQLVTQRMKPANGTIPLHVTNCIPEKRFAEGKFIKVYQKSFWHLRELVRS